MVQIALDNADVPRDLFAKADHVQQMPPSLKVFRWMSWHSTGYGDRRGETTPDVLNPVYF